MKWFLILLSVLSAILISCSSSEKVRYDNYRIFQIRPDNSVRYNLLENHIGNESYQVLRYPRHEDGISELLVPPEKVESFKNFLESDGFDFDVVVGNVQKLIDEEEADQVGRDDFSWTAYHNLDRIYGWLDHILETYPQETSAFVIGKSFEGREIRGLKISYKPNNPGIFVESNIHAREWITSATATYLIKALLTSNDTNVQNIARNFDWYIIPVVNVDGFVYSHQHNRMWRKTRQPHSSLCIGADPNRNFDSYWMANGGASSQPCSETYGGPKPFSEPETLALANFYRSISRKVTLYLAFHSYGQYILFPYGHTNKEAPKNLRDLTTVADDAAKAIRNLYGTRYTVGTVAGTLYIASGGGSDWAYNEGGARLAYTFEFRDKGNTGFLLPARQIIPNAEETLDGIVAMLKSAKNLAYF
ncbi:zinc carboxypeptidase-like [Hermetia illucens]|uniref:zinc carboxypeptidase-like n=1 Tax=Hermetia illucens TaxID=343691 RepID=UPI0018CC66F8|nr:zinc carboxypeptidase-like [Hermetia illucens]